MERSNRLLDCYLPPGEGFLLESLIATTYQVDFEFLEEQLLTAALGVRSSVSRQKTFRSELERKLQKTEISVLYDLVGAERVTRLSPRVDAIPIAGGKLHSKLSLLMWVRESAAPGTAHHRRMRLLVGSANLTRQGFRENYECVSCIDFGGRSESPRALLAAGIDKVRQITAESGSPQLQRQLAAFTQQLARLPVGASGPEDPVAIVGAHEVIGTLRSAWSRVSKNRPESVTIVSPFWCEGSTAAEGMAAVVQQLAPTQKLELVCCGAWSATGRQWLPVFDAAIAAELKRKLDLSISLRPALPNNVAEGERAPVDEGDEDEDRQFASQLTKKDSPDVSRALHAKMIVVDGTEGSVLYAGSSNCTRRGLGLGGPANFEAGVIYRLTSRQRRKISGLLAFAGPPVEISGTQMPSTIKPAEHENKVAPTFLKEVVASDSSVTVNFHTPPPADLVLLMPVPGSADHDEYWLLYPGDMTNAATVTSISTDLAKAVHCDEHLAPLVGPNNTSLIQPHVFVEVRWDGHSATFPVRFDDKTRLPLRLMGRKPTEGELVEYFLFGREPNDWDQLAASADQSVAAPQADTPIDTRGILAYFIRRFVQAIPGIEAEIRRAAHSRVALDCALRGPTSPLELAERALASLTSWHGNGEPAKTPVAVGFQLVEILAAIRRAMGTISDATLRTCFDPVDTRMREMLLLLSQQHAELQTEDFRHYRSRILGGQR